MRKIFICLSFIALGANTLMSDTMLKQPSEIEVLISEIKNAKSTDRRVLMNQLKVQLRAMNQETRTKTMMDLRKSFNKNSSHQMPKGNPVYRSNGKNNMQKRRGEQRPENRPNRPMRDGQKRGK